MHHKKQWGQNKPTTQKDFFELKPYYFTGNQEEDQAILKLREEMVQENIKSRKKIFSNKNKQKEKEDQRVQKTLVVKEIVEKKQQNQINKLKQQVEENKLQRIERFQEKQRKKEKYDKKFESIKQIFNQNETYLQHVLKPESEQNKGIFKENQKIFMEVPEHQSHLIQQKIGIVKQQQEIPEYLTKDYPLNNLNLRKKIIKHHILGQDYRCSDFGIEKTPYYHMKVQNNEKKDRLKENLTDLKIQGFLQENDKNLQKNLDFKKIYKTVQRLNSPQYETHKKMVSPLNIQNNVNLQNFDYEQGIIKNKYNDSTSRDHTQNHGSQSQISINKSNRSHRKLDNSHNFSSLNYLSHIETTTNASNPNKQYVNKLGYKVDQFFTNKNHVKIKI